MARFDGPARSRPETVFSSYVLGLSSIASTCIFYAFLFLSKGAVAFSHPESGDLARLFASFGIGCALALVALVCIRALKIELTIPENYIEFRGKELRTTVVDGELYYLASDVIEAVFCESSERKAALSHLNRQRGCKTLYGKLFATRAALIAAFSSRSDRGSILFIRYLRSTERGEFSAPCVHP